MDFQEAVKKAIVILGPDGLNNKQLINIIADYKAFDEFPQAKDIIPILQKEGVIDEVVCKKNDSLAIHELIHSVSSRFLWPEGKIEYIIRSFIYGTDGDAVNLSNNPIIDVYTSHFDQYIDDVFPNSRPNAIEKLMSLSAISEQEATQIFERWQHFYFIAYAPWDQWIPCSPNDTLTVEQFKDEMSVEGLSFSFYTDEDTGLFCFEIGEIKGKVTTREVPKHPMFSKFIIPYSGVYLVIT